MEPIEEQDINAPLLLPPTAEKTEIEESKGTIFGTIFNVANNVMGAGFLTLPWAFKLSSVLYGSILLFVVCILSTLSFLLLSYCCEKTGSFLYKDIGRISINAKFGVLLQGYCFLYTFGACTSYLVMLGDFLPSILGSCHITDSTITSRPFVVIFSVVVIIFPLSLLKNLDPLKYTSFTGIIFVFYTTFVIVFEDKFFTQSSPDVHYASFSECFLLSIPCTCVAFTAHYNGPRYYKELKDRTPKKFGYVCFAAIAICFICYLCAAVGGYLNFGTFTYGDILKNFPDDDILALIAKIGFGLTLIFHYPLVFHNLRSSFIVLFHPNAPDTFKIRLAYSVVLLFLLTILGIFFTKIELVLGFNGSLFGVFLVFIFPGILYISLHRDRDIKFVISILLICFGVVFSLLGVLGNILKLAQVFKTCN